MKLVGVRAAESANRKKRGEISRIHRDKNKRHLPPDLFDMSEDRQIRDKCVDGQDKIVVSPIFQWTDADVWNFILGKGIPYCELYDRGWKRIGCLMFPMARKSERSSARVLYPGIEVAIIRSIGEVMLSGGMKSMVDRNASPQEVFDWWISGESIAKYFGMLRNQWRLEL